jgi:hypothetical protein
MTPQKKLPAFNLYLTEMSPTPNFDVTSTGPVSSEFRARGLHSFASACNYIKRLPYGRNADKTRPLTVFSDGCGTCGTKHALLKQLADENGFGGLTLVIAICRMTPENSPLVRHVLQQYDLAYLPEAHNYLKYKNSVVDMTAEEPLAINDEMLEEIEIEPNQITEYKVALHKAYIDNWRRENDIPYPLDKLWEIREACIAALSGL